MYFGSDTPAIYWCRAPTPIAPHQFGDSLYPLGWCTNLELQLQFEHPTLLHYTSHPGLIAALSVAPTPIPIGATGHCHFAVSLHTLDCAAPQPHSSTALGAPPYNYLAPLPLCICTLLWPPHNAQMGEGSEVSPRWPLTSVTPHHTHTLGILYWE